MMKQKNKTRPQSGYYQCEKCKSTRGHSDMYDEDICYKCYDEAGAKTMKTNVMLNSINLKISNIVFSGRMPFKHKLNYKEVSKLILNSKLNWSLINEEISPIIRRYVEKENITVHKKKGNAHISLWTSGAIVITGVTTTEEAIRFYKETLKDINKFCKRVLKR